MKKRRYRIISLDHYEGYLSLDVMKILELFLNLDKGDQRVNVSLYVLCNNRKKTVLVKKRENKHTCFSILSFLIYGKQRVLSYEEVHLI
jgi:hypothetical protein